MWDGGGFSPWPIPVTMAVFHDEVEIEDFQYDEDSETYFYPCPCGDNFSITKVTSGPRPRIRRRMFLAWLHRPRGLESPMPPFPCILTLSSQWASFWTLVWPRRVWQGVRFP